MTPAFEPRNLAEAMAVRLMTRADQAYTAGDWASALPVYRHLIDSQPTVAHAFALELAAGHCAIELADGATLADGPANPAPATDAPRAATFAHDIRVRAQAYCRQRDFVRASALLRLIARIDEPTRVSYDDGLLFRRSDCTALLHAPDDAPPGFVTDYAIDALPLEQLKARHRGKRLLLVRRYGDTKQRYGVADNLHRAAVAFGLAVQEVASVVKPGAASEVYVPSLVHIIETFRPDVIFWDELFLSGISADPAYADTIAAMLEEARRHLGLKVIKYYSDVWYVTRNMPDQLYAHLGRCYDLINHCHPAILDRGTAAERDAVFCCPAPAIIEPPTAEAGAIPRACFVGTLHAGGAATRVVWWAEATRAGLPFDFIETAHDRTIQLSDLDYVNTMRRYQLSVTLTMRNTGARIFTARAFEIPLAGGVLLEEHSLDTRYFLKPGIHYAAFETLPDLAALIPELLADAPRRAAMAAAAQAWVARYYGGDYYWAGMLAKLYP
jgi:hypothetical protein